MAEKATANFEQALKANGWAKTSQCVSTKPESLAKYQAIDVFAICVYVCICVFVCLCASGKVINVLVWTELLMQHS